MFLIAGKCGTLIRRDRGAGSRLLANARKSWIKKNLVNKINLNLLPALSAVRPCTADNGEFCVNAKHRNCFSTPDILVGGRTYVNRCTSLYISFRHTSVYVGKKRVLLLKTRFRLTPRPSMDALLANFGKPKCRFWQDVSDSPQNRVCAQTRN